MSSLPGREKWNLLLAGKDAGPMVSPLCDDWSLDVPYRWPFEEPEPFPPGKPYHALGQQMAMAGVCGYDPTFLCAVEFRPRDPKLVPQTATEKIDGGSRSTSRLPTPYGEMLLIDERKVTSHTVRNWLETKEDYRRMAWWHRASMDYDEDLAIGQGLQCRRAIGDRGPMGTWFGPPIPGSGDMLFYHLTDWPEACAELRAATRELQLKQIRTLRKAGFDYLFYCVQATEWISPDFFRLYLADDIGQALDLWRSLGGWVLWHSCGKVAKFIEEGFYNDYKPEVFETMSEPPVGSLPSLRWGRERLDRSIVTKGNLPLNILRDGTPEDVRQGVARIRQETKGYRHVVGLSDDMLKGTPLVNAKALVEEARRHEPLNPTGWS